MTSPSALALAPGDGFAVYDELLVITETWNMEQWLDEYEDEDEDEDITFFSRIWEESLDEAAAYGHEAHRIIARARAALSRGRSDRLLRTSMYLARAQTDSDLHEPKSLQNTAS